MLSENLRTTSLVREHPRLPCVKGAGSRVPRKRETEGLSNLHSQGVPGKRKVLIPSVMALRETAMTAPLGQQGEPLAAIGRLPCLSLWERCPAGAERARFPSQSLRDSSPRVGAKGEPLAANGRPYLLHRNPQKNRPHNPPPGRIGFTARRERPWRKRICPTSCN